MANHVGYPELAMVAFVHAMRSRRLPLGLGRVWPRDDCKAEERHDSNVDEQLKQHLPLARRLLVRTLSG